MRVAIDHQIFCRQMYGGVSRYFTNLATQLYQQNQQVRVFAPYHRNEYLSRLPSGLVDGSRLGAYPPRTAGTFLYLNYLAAKRRMRKWSPEVVHETYFSRNSVSPKGCPVVITVYDMIGELYPPVSGARVLDSGEKKSAVERADHIVCISQSTRDDLIDVFDVPRCKTSVVYMGFEAFDSAQCQPDSCSSGKKFVLYVGARAGYKNFMGLAQAFASSPRLATDFDIVAFGGGKFSAQEIAQVQRLGFGEGGVRQVSGDDRVLASLYRSASALVYPSLYEGFGLPPLEAMAHNCPVVSSNSSSMPEVIGHAAEFFNPDSVEEMGEALEAVLYSSSRSRELRLLGKARLKKFSWEKCATETMEVYHNVI